MKAIPCSKGSKPCIRLSGYGVMEVRPKGNFAILYTEITSAIDANRYTSRGHRLKRPASANLITFNDLVFK